MLLQQKHIRHPAMRIILKALRREQLQQCWALGFSAFMGLIIFVLFAHQFQILAAIGFGILLICSRFLFIKIKHLNDSENKFLDIVLHQPQKIVWVYSIIFQRMPFGFQMAKSGVLYLKMSDGDEIAVSLSEKHLRITSRFLNKWLPEATFGYTEERAQWYNAHPEMLRKNE